MLLEASSVLFVYRLRLFLYIFSYASTAASLTLFTGYAIGLSVLVVEDIMVEAQLMSTEVFTARALMFVLRETAVFLILISSEWVLYNIQQTTTQTPYGFLVAALVVATPIVMLPLVTFKVTLYGLSPIAIPPHPLTHCLMAIGQSYWFECRGWSRHKQSHPTRGNSTRLAYLQNHEL